MTTAVPAYQIPSIASGKEPTGTGVPMPNFNPRPILPIQVTIIPAPAFSSLRSEPAVGFPA